MRTILRETPYPRQDDECSTAPSVSILTTVYNRELIFSANASRVFSNPNSRITSTSSSMTARQTTQSDIAKRYAQEDPKIKSLRQ